MTLPRYSEIGRVNEAVQNEVYFMGAAPYDFTPGAKLGTMTIADLIEKIRYRFGSQAAASIRITVH